MLRIFVFLLLSIISLSGCQSISNHGEYIDDSRIKAIEKNHISKEQVLDLLGEPTIVPDYTPDTWYYVSRKVQDKVWSRPGIRKQRIVKINFKGNNVETIEINDKKPKSNINIERDFTEAKGTEETAIQTFVKNFGRFNKTTRKKRR